MMLRADSNIPITGDGDGDSCPSLIDLAAYAGGRLGEEENEHLEAHVAGCASCLALLERLRTEVTAVDDEARRLLPPAGVLEAAMSLRTGEAPARLRAAEPWRIFSRRAAALAACAAIAAGGYLIGDSLAAPSASDDPSLVASTNGLDFGLLESGASDAFSDDGLFALLEVDAGATKEATP
jgi:anti-sigma factor RsiW